MFAKLSGAGTQQGGKMEQDAFRMRCLVVSQIFNSCKAEEKASVVRQGGKNRFARTAREAVVAPTI